MSVASSVHAVLVNESFVAIVYVTAGFLINIFEGVILSVVIFANAAEIVVNGELILPSETPEKVDSMYIFCDKTSLNKHMII